MEDRDPRDKLILSLCEKLSICSTLLTRAAERLSWDNEHVQELMRRLDASIKSDCRAAGVTEDTDPLLEK